MTLTYKTAGESHGPELTAICEGLPAGMPLSVKDINRQLARRQLGFGRGGRMKIEKDEAVITSGVRHGLTLGTPIAMRIENRDWQNWCGVMAVEKPVTGKSAKAAGREYGSGKPAGPESRSRNAASGKRGRQLTVPRPGHADLAGSQKYGLNDIRSVLERASARETAARVAVGALAMRLLGEFDIEVYSHVVQIGKVKTGRRARVTVEALKQVDKSPVRCLDPTSEKPMMDAITAARKAGESVGGVFEVIVYGLIPGLGSYSSGPERLGGRIGGALMSIPAIKGAEIGDGFASAGRPGSTVHDEVFFNSRRGFFRRTNHAGGLEGGITNGEPLVARAAMKPIPTLTSPLRSADMSTGKPAPAIRERSDVCAVPAAAVVGEAMVAIELARALLEKFGGDCVGDTREAWLAYLRRLRRSWPDVHDE